MWFIPSSQFEGQLFVSERSRILQIGGGSALSSSEQGLRIDIRLLIRWVAELLKAPPAFPRSTKYKNH